MTDHDKPTTLAEACLEGLVDTDFGFRYQPDLGARAVTDFALSPEQIEKSAKAMWQARESELPPEDRRAWEEALPGEQRWCRIQAEAVIRANLGVNHD